MSYYITVNVSDEVINGDQRNLAKYGIALTSLPNFSFVFARWRQ